MNVLHRLAAACLIVLCAALIGSSAARAMEIQRVVSPGGIEAWLVEEHSLPLIVAEIGWKGGTAQDPEGKEGLTTMLSALLSEGAGARTAQQFQEALDDKAIKLSFDADTDSTGASLETLVENKEEAFALLADALTEPRFDSQDIERIRAQMKVAIRRDAEDPDRIAARAWYRSALGDHPYARPSKGDVRSVNRVNREDLQAQLRRLQARDNLHVAVVGDITPAALAGLLDRTFGGLPEQSRLRPMPEASVVPAGRIEVIQRDIPQSVLIFGLEGLKRSDPDFIPAYVMNHILGGGGFSSRLMNEVREKRGLAYSVVSYLYPLDHAGLFIGQVATENTRVSESLDVIRQEIARMREEGVSDQELQDAKTYLTGSYPLRFDSNAKIASQLNLIQLEGLGIDYVDRRNDLIESVTREDLLRAARRFLSDDKLIVAIVGNPPDLQ